MKRTISNKVFMNMVAQSSEAEIFEDFVVAENLTKQIVKYADLGVRADNEKYEYSKEDLCEDVKGLMWDIFGRIADYYNEVPDGREVSEAIDFESENLIESFENLIHGKVGPFEPEVPGEERETEEDALEVPEEFIKFDEDEAEEMEEKEETSEDEECEDEDDLDMDDDDDDEEECEDSEEDNEEKE
jgi:hypothetical protein